MRLKGRGTGKQIGAHEVQARIAMLRRSIGTRLIRIEPESTLSYRSDDTRQSKKMFAILDWALLIMEVFKSGWCRAGCKGSHRAASL